MRLADDAAQDRPIEQRTEGADEHNGEEEGQPISDAVPDDEHVAGESAEHHEVALGEVHQLRRLVDQHEAERDQAVNAADRKPVQRQL